jgi:TolB-like protein/class 3 adenylate cyclase/Flp pilus assembly protein TadD
MGDPERRLATIMAADIVGYSTMMDTDEEGTYTDLRAVRSDIIEPTIRDFGGRIVKHLGDGFLAEFPTVNSAVQCAMAMQEEMARRGADVPDEHRIRFRIGISLGDIIVDDDGDIFGDGVNVAAHLEPLAVPGGICVSDTVYAAVHKKLDVGFDDLGEQRSKEDSPPVHAYALRWPGEGSTPDERAVKPTASPKSVGWISGAAVTAAAVIGLVLWQTSPFEPGNEVAPDLSIAVLPFVSMSSDPEQEYFSDGISEELLSLLAQVPELRVISRSSAFTFKGKDMKLPDIARELNVAHILEGSVQKADDEVRITAQLIEAQSDVHLWSGTFDRTLDDIFTIQDEIAAAVVEALKLTLLGGPPEAESTDAEAFTLFLQARYLAAQGTAEDYERAIELYNQVLAIAPDYARAWRGLAVTYLNQGNKGLRTRAESRVLAREALDEALAIDPDYSKAHSLLGMFSLALDGDLEAAASHFKHALSSDPTDLSLLSNSSSLLLRLGRLDETIAVREYDVSRDPLDPVGYNNLAWAYLMAGQPDGAISCVQTLATLAPNYGGARNTLGRALLLKGEHEAALEAMLEEPSEVWRLLGLVVTYHTMGRGDESDATLAELIEKYGDDRAYHIAMVLALRGEADRAFEWLDRAARDGSPSLSYIAVETLFSNIHSDRRWMPFLESMGKSPEQLAAIEFEVRLPQ